MRKPRWNWSRAGVAVGIGALAVGALASVGAAVSPNGTKAAATQYQPHKVMLCHHTHSKTHPFVTIIVSQRALPAHLRHGDTIGSCPQIASKQLKPKKTHASHAKSRAKRDAPAKKATVTAPVRAAAAERAASTQSRSGTAPGRADTAPGHTASPPHGGTPPGHGGSPPGDAASPPAPSPAGNAPGHGASPPHGGTPPGHGGTPPGQGATSPGNGGTPPGHGGTPPGKDK